MPHSRPSWLRRLRRVCVFLVLGLGTTLVTAFAVAQPIWSAWIASAWIYDGYRYIEGDEVRTEWQASHAPGLCRTEVAAACAAEPVPTESTRADRAADPSWERLQLRPGESAIVCAAGWPLRTFQYGDLSRIDAELVYGGAWHFRWPDTSTFPPSTNEVVVPWSPIWPGLAFNTLFYALLWWLGLASVRMVKHNRRYRHGLCPLCRYDLRADYSQGCSECGWKRG